MFPIADGLAVVTVFTAALSIGAAYHRIFVATGTPGAFGQAEFAAAVAQACGRGFIDIPLAASPNLGPFLNVQRDTFSCAELPASLEPREPNLTQRLYRYLMSSVALVWTWQGAISWSGVGTLIALLYGASAVAAYALLRLGVGPLLAATGALFLAVSPNQLAMIVYLRDYAKAPFLLALMAILGLIVSRRLPPRAYVAAAAAYGLILGIGFGFRNDLLIAVPPFLVTVWLFHPAGLRRWLRVKAAATVVGAATFVVAAWPIIQGYEKGSNTGHVALLGLATPFEQPLGVRGSLYEWNQSYDDGFASSLIRAYSMRMHGRDLSYLSAEYDRAMVEYVFAIARHWPADMLLRGYASIVKVLDLPFAMGVHTRPVPYGLAAGGRASHLYELAFPWLRRATGGGWLLTIVALGFLSLASVRVASWALLFVLYFGAYPAIQFHLRHFFHLEILSIWAGAFVLSATGLAIWRTTARLVRRERAIAPSVPLRAVVFVVLVAAAILVPLESLRAYQQQHVRGLVTEYLAAERDELTPEPAPVEGGRTLLRLAQLGGTVSPSAIRAHYLVTEVGSTECGVLLLPITFRYLSPNGWNLFSKDVSIELDTNGGTTMLLTPAYDNAYSYLSGVEVPTADVGCVSRVSRLRHAERFPLFVGLTLPPDWRERRLYHTLRDWEAEDGDGARPAFYLAPPDLRLPPAAIASDERGFDEPDSLTPIVHRTGRGFLIKGTPGARYEYAITYREAPRGEGTVLVARGRVVRGGITIGLLRDGRWASSVNVASGAFIAAIRVPEGAAYQVVVANWLQVEDTVNEVEIESLSWLEPPPQ